MKKNKNWKKRVLLAAFAGTIGISFTGCKANEEVAITQEADFESKRSINDNNDFVENINGEWKNYKAIAQVTYKVQGLDKFFVVMVGLEEIEENKYLYHCFTIPEIYLEETYDKDTYTTNYRFIPMEGIKEHFTQTTEIMSVSFQLVGKDVYSYNEIQAMEDEAAMQKNEEVNDKLGR